MTTLVVIEAPGKVEALSSILNLMDFEGKVFATGGHLFSSPDDLAILGIDGNFQETMRQPVNPGLVERLIQAAADADFVIIATDPDQEGEAIAKDVADLVTGKTVLRARFHGLDRASVEKGLAAIGKFNVEDAWPGIARRVIDRLIGRFMMQEPVNIPSGRVQSAILGILGRKPAPIAELTLLLPASDGGSDFIAKVNVNWFNKERADEMLELSKELEAAPVDDKKTVEVLAATPWNMGDILCNTKERIGCSVKDVEEALQSMYEGGIMSYPRASARGVGEGALDCLTRIADRHNIAGRFDRRHLKDVGSHAHASPYPLGDRFDIGMPIKLMNHKDAILALTTRNLILSGIMARSEAPDAYHLPKWAKSLEWERKSMPSMPWKDPLPEAGLKAIDPQVSVIRAMMSIGVGRPGTYVDHAEKFLSRGLVGADMKMTDKGRRWMDTIPESLTAHENSGKIEAFIEKAGFRPETMVAMIVDQLGSEVSSAIIKSANSGGNI